MVKCEALDRRAGTGTSSPTRRETTCRSSNGARTGSAAPRRFPPRNLSARGWARSGHGHSCPRAAGQVSGARTFLSVRGWLGEAPPDTGWTNAKRKSHGLENPCFHGWSPHALSCSSKRPVCHILHHNNHPPHTAIWRISSSVSATCRPSGAGSSGNGCEMSRPASTVSIVGKRLPSAAMPGIAPSRPFV